jgi:hypothetical protein
MSAPSKIQYEIMIDWDATDWSAVPDYSEDYDDVISDLQNITRAMGKDQSTGNCPAATCDILLRNYTGKYSPGNVDSPIYGLLRPWLPVRVRAEFPAESESWTTIFTGFISRIKVEPYMDRQTIYLYCTDGLDFLSRVTTAQDWNDRTSMTDGEAVGKILDSAGWSATKRTLDVDGGDITQYPTTTEY